MSRYTMRVQLDEGGRSALVEVADKCGMTQIAVMSRVMNWFVNQNEVIQAGILGALSPEAVADLARQLLKQMAAGKETQPKRRKPGGKS
jgi:hypothetical protein